MENETVWKNILPVRVLTSMQVRGILEPKRQVAREES
jgi:hypothetical protein